MGSERHNALHSGAALNAVGSGELGGLTAHFCGLPTNRSQRATRETDAPAILSMLQADGADVALLVPNCTVCHQCVALTARHLVANGIATVVMAGMEKSLLQCSPSE